MNNCYASLKIWKAVNFASVNAVVVEIRLAKLENFHWRSIIKFVDALIDSCKSRFYLAVKTMKDVFRYVIGGKLGFPYFEYQTV